MNTNTPTLDQLKRGLEIAQQIAALEAQMAAIFAGKAVPAAPSASAQPGKKRKRKFSAQALANIRAAQKKRWAKVTGKKTSAASEKKKRKLSPKALANIRAAQKKRWAKVKGQAASAKAVPAKASSEKAPSKKKRKLTPEVRAKLAAAMKARWEAAKKSGTPPPTAKK